MERKGKKRKEKNRNIKIDQKLHPLLIEEGK